jgi:5-methylcytosine-specific restriction protein A
LKRRFTGDKSGQLAGLGEMGKLSALKPVLRTLSPRLGVAVGDKQAQERARDQRNDWRSWYKTKRWQDLRMQVFVRDAFVCQRTGVLCIGKHPASNSPVANHKKAHRGDPELFWDINNIETVTKEVHDSLIQAEEQSVPTGQWH